MMVKATPAVAVSHPSGVVRLIDPSAGQPDMAAGPTTIAVNTGRCLRVVFLSCVLFEVVLVGLDLTTNWWGWNDNSAMRRLFSITREDSLASWFAVVQTTLVALFIWLVAAVVHHQRAPVLKQYGWVLAALLFTYMSVDDGAAVHERLGTALHHALGHSALSAVFPAYAWKHLLLPLFALTGALALYFLWAEMPRAADRAKVAGAFACFVLAVGMDIVEGMQNPYQGLSQATGWDGDAIGQFSNSLEEFVEMLGMSILLIAFAGHLAAVAPRLEIRFGKGPASPPPPPETPGRMLKKCFRTLVNKSVQRAEPGACHGQAGMFCSRWSTLICPAPMYSRVHMMIDSHLKVLISGRSSPPTRAPAAGDTATPMPPDWCSWRWEARGSSGCSASSCAATGPCRPPRSRCAAASWSTSGRSRAR